MTRSPHTAPEPQVSCQVIYHTLYGVCRQDVDGQEEVIFGDYDYQTVVDEWEDNNAQYKYMCIALSMVTVNDSDAAKAAFNGKFIVTFDHLENEEVSTTSTPDTVAVFKAFGSEFRLYDDDDELYYTGYQFTDGSEDSIFAPLDQYGTPNAGCTYIKILNEDTNTWEAV